jgi:predicted nucleic acid-binding protein
MKGECVMRILLDTNIIIHRETNRIVQKEIGTLFYWFDKLHHEKCIHPLSIEEIKKYQDASVVETMEAKIKNYVVLKTHAPDALPIKNIRSKYDKNENDSIDTTLLNEVFVGRVDLLITEDRKIHRKASELGISVRVFTIDAFLEKVVAENPELTDYKVLAVRKKLFGEIDISDPFFDSFKNDYAGFDKWFVKKSDEIAYVCNSEDGHILAFLFLKVEDQNENYSDITPQFSPKRRLKIGTFKVISNGYKLGERFLKIVFDNALLFNVEEIYVTIFDKTEDQDRLIQLLADWGFCFWGHKNTVSGEELVFVRDFLPSINKDNPCLTYPYFSNHQRKFIVPIYPEYHTELFPDSILRTESPKDYIENRPNRNAISKVYISRSPERSLETGDVIVFYRTKYNGPAHYTSVATTIGVVQNLITNIRSLEHFIELCRKRSVYTDKELAAHWHYNSYSRPFIVNFLYVSSFSKRLNLNQLIERGIITEAPRSFTPISDTAFQKLLEDSNADQRLVVN